MKRHRKWVIPAAVLLVLCLVVGRVVAVNATATRFQEMSYPQGEWVPLEGDFFYTSLENTDGYFVRVSSAEAMTYEEFLERFEKPLDYLGEESRHDVIVLKVDFKNQDNTQGGVLIRDLNLVNSARSQSFNPSVNYMAIANPDFDPYTEGIKIQPGTEASLFFVYDTVSRADKVTYLEQQAGKESLTMFLNVSLYPVHKMVELEVPLTVLHAKKS